MSASGTVEAMDTRRHATGYHPAPSAGSHTEIGRLLAHQAQRRVELGVRVFMVHTLLKQRRLGHLKVGVRKPDHRRAPRPVPRGI